MTIVAIHNHALFAKGKNTQKRRVRDGLNNTVDNFVHMILHCQHTAAAIHHQPALDVAFAWRPSDRVAVKLVGVQDYHRQATESADR